MRLIKTSAILSGVLALGISAQANAASYTSAQNAKLVDVCIAAKSDREIKLRQAVRNANLSFQQVAEEVKCNGVNPIEFAYQNQAYKTANLLAERSGVVNITELAARYGDVEQSAISGE